MPTEQCARTTDDDYYPFADYVRRRLAGEGRSDIIDRWDAGEIKSEAEAARAAGFDPVPPPGWDLLR
jgi:hypothetical protein